MAIERKLKDPGAAALSAVEQALNLDPREDKAAATPRDPGPRLPDINDADLLQPSAGPTDVDERSRDRAADIDDTHAERGPSPLVAPDRAAAGPCSGRSRLSACSTADRAASPGSLSFFSIAICRPNDA